jgi:hypothetical protein
MKCTMCGKIIEGQDETQDYAIIVCSHCGGVFLKTPEMNLGAESSVVAESPPPAQAPEASGPEPVSFGWRAGPQSDSFAQSSSGSAFDALELKQDAFAVQAGEPVIAAVPISAAPAAAPPIKEVPHPLQNVGLPTRGVSQVHQKRGRLRMAWPWQRGFMRLLFTAWAAVWYIGTIIAAIHYYDSEKMGCMFGVLPAMLLLGYFPLVNAVNNEVIEVSRYFIMRSCQPLPWFGNLKIPSSEVKQIYCKEDRKRLENDRPTYTVNAILKSNKEIVLVAWIERTDEALFIETQAEEQLGIVDVPVPGEVPK